MTGTALVLADDFGIFLPVARSLGRRGVTVHATISDPHLPGLESRYVAARIPLPSYHASAAAWLERMRALQAEHRYDLVVPCSDSDLHILARHARDLPEARLAVPNREAFACFTDKAATRALAQRLGVAVAQGGPVEPESSAAELAGAYGLPLVLKPAASYRLGERETKRRAAIVRDLAGLEAALAHIPADGALAESFFEGIGVGVSVLARSGEILFAWQHRRLRAVSETGGSSVRIGEKVDPRLLADAAALARATLLDGVAMFEFRCDRARGAHVLLEVNARFWGSLPLAVESGADFPAWLWDSLAGNEPPLRPPRIGLVKRSLTGELDRLIGALDCARSLEGRIAAATALLGLGVSTLAPRRFDSWAADDPAPFAAERRDALGRAAARVKRLFRRSGAAASPGAADPIA